MREFSPILPDTRNMASILSEQGETSGFRTIRSQHLGLH